MKTPDWVQELRNSIPQWLDKVAVPKQPGRFYPCLNGRTKVGNEAALGFSCFALRIYCIIGIWERLEGDQNSKWIDFIQSFQQGKLPNKGAFVDPPILKHCDPWRARIIRILLRRGHPGFTHQESVRIAETKQAIATLAQVGVQAPLPFKGFPLTAEEIHHYLRAKLKWSRPWAAGGQAAAHAVFVSNEAPKFLSHADSEELKQEMRSFFNQILDPETGGWYIHRRPDHGQLINGAMKVLNALEWLDAEPTHPERLIDSCLDYVPPPYGCHLVNTVYVLYQCCKYTKHRRQEILGYCIKILEMIHQHYQLDGAFSYFLDHNQTHYYGAKIATSMWQSDIHGTYLLTFAIAMIGNLLEWGNFGWEFIRT